MPELLLLTAFAFPVAVVWVFCEWAVGYIRGGWQA